MLSLECCSGESLIGLGGGFSDCGTVESRWRFLLSFLRSIIRPPPCRRRSRTTCQRHRCRRTMLFSHDTVLITHRMARTMTSLNKQRTIQTVSAFRHKRARPPHTLAARRFTRLLWRRSSPRTWTSQHFLCWRRRTNVSKVEPTCSFCTCVIRLAPSCPLVTHRLTHVLPDSTHFHSCTSPQGGIRSHIKSQSRTCGLSLSLFCAPHTG